MVYTKINNSYVEIQKEAKKGEKSITVKSLGVGALENEYFIITHHKNKYSDYVHISYMIDNGQNPYYRAGTFDIHDHFWSGKIEDETLKVMSIGVLEQSLKSDNIYEIYRTVSNFVLTLLLNKESIEQTPIAQNNKNHKIEVVI